MAANNTMNQEYDWDDEIENRSGFADVPDGEYEFFVDHYERAKVGGDGKYSGQNKAIVYCNILMENVPQDQAPQFKTNLILNKAFDWKLSQFFISIGLMPDEEGATLKMNWNLVGGARGRCKVEHKPNMNDATKTHPEIVEFLKPRKGKKWGAGF